MDINQFSAREKEVIDLLLQGKSNKQIALALDISVRTVEFHLKNIYKKLQVTSRAEAILRLGKTTASAEPVVKRVESPVDGGQAAVENGRNIFPTRRLLMKHWFTITLGGLLIIFIAVAAVVFLRGKVTATTAPTPISPAATSSAGTPITFYASRFNLPPALGTRTLNEVIQASNEYAALWPTHTRAIVADYPLQNTTYQPQIRIFFTEEYAQLSPDAATAIQSLQAILKSQQIQKAEALPYLPLERSWQVYHAQEKFLSFQNGQGLRYITYYSQAAFPIQKLSYLEPLYTFQGLSDDGKSYVSVTMPLSLDYVTVDENNASPFPDNGIPFNWDNPNPAEYPAYLDQAVVLLNHKNNPFNPSLEVLDTLVQSLLVNISQ